jgi:hypothetical protein
MTITLLPEQEQLIRKMIESGLAKTPEEALTQALALLRDRLPESHKTSDSRPEVAKRLAQFASKHNLSLGDMTIKDLLDASRP